MMGYTDILMRKTADMNNPDYDPYLKRRRSSNLASTGAILGGIGGFMKGMSEGGTFMPKTPGESIFRAGIRNTLRAPVSFGKGLLKGGLWGTVGYGLGKLLS